MKRRRPARSAPASNEARLRELFEQWKNLKAWRGRSFDRVKLVVRAEYPRDVLGEVGLDGRQGRWKIVVVDKTHFADSAATLLHEMAHVAVWVKRDIHGGAWRRCFTAAATEVTGHLFEDWNTKIDDFDVREIDADVEMLLASWIHGVAPPARSLLDADDFVKRLMFLCRKVAYG